MRRTYWRSGLLSLVSLVCAFALVTTDKSTAGQAAPPPYDADGNRLIDRQVAQTHQGDPDYIKDGKFYDVGRNPDPKPGFQQTTSGDYRFRVTHIKFDISSDDGPADVPGEGLELWYHGSWGGRLDHLKDGRSRGEWVYRWATSEGSVAGRNEPALYACKDAVKVMARIESASQVASAHIGAKQVVAQGQGAQWVDVKAKKVEFQESARHPNQVWVSKGAPNSPDDPTQGFSEYVELHLAAPIKDSINKSECIWQWYVDRILTLGGQPGDEWVAGTVCNGTMDGWEINRSEGYRETLDADGNVIFNPVPHTFYTVLGKPASPFYRPMSSGSNAALEIPFVTALDFAIVTEVKLAGEASSINARERIARFCFAEYGLHYDHEGGAARFLDSATMGSMGSRDLYWFDFQSFLLRGRGAKVNCVDQACAVATLMDLVSGVDAEVEWLPEFGYVSPSNFVGNAAPPRCNNPFFEDGAFVSTPLVGDDDTRWRMDDAGKMKRSLFSFHTWVNAGGLIYDATVGPQQDASAQPVPEIPTLVADHASYRTARCDVSSTGPIWRDDERVPQARSENYGAISPAVPWLESGYDDEGTVYEIKVQHADFLRRSTKSLNLSPQ